MTFVHHFESTCVGPLPADYEHAVDDRFVRDGSGDDDDDDDDDDNDSDENDDVLMKMIIMMIVSVLPFVA